MDTSMGTTTVASKINAIAQASSTSATRMEMDMGNSCKISVCSTWAKGSSHSADGFLSDAMELEYGRLVLYLGLLANYFQRDVCRLLHWCHYSSHSPWISTSSGKGVWAFFAKKPQTTPSTVRIGGIHGRRAIMWLEYNANFQSHDTSAECPGPAAYGAICSGLFHHAVSDSPPFNRTDYKLTCWKPCHVLQWLLFDLHPHRRLHRLVRLLVGTCSIWVSFSWFAQITIWNFC